MWKGSGMQYHYSHGSRENSDTPCMWEESGMCQEANTMTFHQLTVTQSTNTCGERLMSGKLAFLISLMRSLRAEVVPIAQHDPQSAVISLAKHHSINKATYNVHVHMYKSYHMNQLPVVQLHVLVAWLSMQFG